MENYKQNGSVSRAKQKPQRNTSAIRKTAALAAGLTKPPLKFPKDSVRFPTVLLVCALFLTLGKKQQRPYYKEQTALPRRAPFVVDMKQGYAFDQFDFDIAVVLWYLLGGQEFIDLEVGQILTELGLRKDTRMRARVVQVLRRLAGFKHDEDGEYAAPKFILDGIKGIERGVITKPLFKIRPIGHRYRIQLSDEARVFLQRGNWTLLEWNKFVALKSGLERRLYGFMRAQRPNTDRPHRVLYEDLRRYLGYMGEVDAGGMRVWKHRLKAAMHRLKEMGVVCEVCFTSRRLTWKTEQIWLI